MNDRRSIDRASEQTDEERRPTTDDRRRDRPTDSCVQQKLWPTRLSGLERERPTDRATNRANEWTKSDGRRMTARLTERRRAKAAAGDRRRDQANLCYMRKSSLIDLLTDIFFLSVPGGYISGVSELPLELLLFVAGESFFSCFVLCAYV